MENWGLVTYREQYLLFNEVTGTTRDQENVITTIAHEFAVGTNIIIYDKLRSEVSNIGLDKENAWFDVCKIRQFRHT